MPFAVDERLAAETWKGLGDYLTTFTSKGGQVRADIYRRGRLVEAHVWFPTGLDSTQVTDPYISELENYAREHGVKDVFRVYLADF
jgi:hypothetical protein